MASPEPERQAPPTGEEIHLPGPSILPLFNALGIALIVVGTTLGLPVVIIGALIFVYTTVRWIRDTRRDVSELPPHHHSSE